MTEARTAPAAAQQTPGAVPVRAVAASVVCLTATVMPGFLAGALGSDVKAAFGIGDTGLGVTLALTYLLSGVASVHAGELADRIGARRGLLLSMGVTLGGFLAVAALARSFAMLLVSMVVAGAGLTLAGPAAKVLLAQHVPPRRHGVAFAVHMSGIPLAPLLAGLAVPLVGGTSGWRWAFVGGAILTVIGALLVPPEVRNEPAAAQKPAASGRFGHVSLAPLFVLGAAATLASSAVFSAAAFFVVNSESAGISEDAAGLLLSATSAGVITARILLGVASDRGRGGDIGTVAALLFVSSAGYAMMAADTAWLYILGGQIAMIVGWSWTALLVASLVRTHPHAPGLATSFAIGGMNLGAVVGPGAFGAISDLASSSVALSVAALGVLAAAGLCLVGRRIQARHCIEGWA